MDIVGAHRPQKVREVIVEGGCELIYLPPYSSPDLNPIEEAFRGGQASAEEDRSSRAKEALVEALSLALGAVSAQDTGGCFAHCGYIIPAQQL